jgi:hypothetical protein
MSSRSGGKAKSRNQLTGVVVAVAGALLVAMVVLLALTLSELRSAREHIAATDAKVSALVDVAAPAARQLSPLADEAEPLVDSATPVVRALGAALPSLRSAGAVLGPALPRLPAFLISGQQLIAEAVPVLREVADSGLAPTLEQARQLLTDVPVARLDEVLTQVSGLLDQAATMQLPENAERAVDLLQEVLAVQHHLVTLQTRSVRIQSRSLDVQRRTLSHTRSIDNRLGGQLAPPPLGTDLP